jgi:hypothetical protein
MSTSHGRILTSQRIGPHRIELEPPNIVHIHYGGDVELAHFQGFNDVMTIFPQSTPLYLLRNARNGGVVAPETRKYIATTTEQSRFVAIATYSASFQSKTVFSNMSRAMRSTRPAGTIPIGFFDTEDEARAWLAHLQADSEST